MRLRDMEELIKKVEQWSVKRGLNTADPSKQRLKLWEEFGELNASMARNDREGAIDAIGDMLVVMIIYCQQKKYYSIYRLFEFDIENYEFLRKLETEALIDSTAYEILHLRNFIQSIKDIVTRLSIIAERYGAELDWCLESAYDEIKDRRGKMVNGVFVKESDLNG
ncbi:MazG-like family protein [Enterococcus cecorum]|uniref:MazG-like family protein n=1 Tax=Enterococcus cecorum TaxID=44008 RepID=UPI002ACAECA9|nr:MazG-like family protein [Enterococcus cecorum]MDZ5578610.1 MazG-like family protein [Enterococcus cecorum]